MSQLPALAASRRLHLNADDIQRWFEGAAADGFNLMPDALPGDCAISSMASCGSCSSAAFSAANTKAQRCASMSD